jgi:hypothetical protein
MPPSRRPYGSSDTLVLRFLWVPHGEEPDPVELAKFQDPIRVPARFVPRRRAEAEPVEVASAHDPRPPTGLSLLSVAKGGIGPGQEHTGGSHQARSCCSIMCMTWQR